MTKILLGTVIATLMALGTVPSSAREWCYRYERCCCCDHDGWSYLFPGVAHHSYASVVVIHGDRVVYFIGDEYAWIPLYLEELRKQKSAPAATPSSPPPASPPAAPKS